MKASENVKYLIGVLLFCFTVQIPAPLSAQTEQSPPLMWVSDRLPEEKDSRVAFFGKLNLPASIEGEVKISGSSWYNVWIDNELFIEGPDRYLPAHPQYQSKPIALTAGEHIIAVEVHHFGVETRMLENIDPFLMFQLKEGDREIAIDWRCTRLKGYNAGKYRINPQLGWIDWLDTRQPTYGWRRNEFNHSEWGKPVEVKRPLGRFTESGIDPVKFAYIDAKLVAQGEFSEQFGYENDNPSVMLYLRDLSLKDLPAQGIWRRYDLGKVLLMRPSFVVDLPEGSTVDFIYSERLIEQKVSPWITLSAGESNNFDRFIARGGLQEFCPLSPKGGRYVEVHIKAPPKKIAFLKEQFISRYYFDEPTTTFECSDLLLNKIWTAGMETFRSCAEDALVDNPTRERGQWMGDVGLVGAEVNAVLYSDMRLIRRGLIQFAHSANGEGIVAGLTPGGKAYLSSYALQWISACMNYYHLTGDKSLLEELYHAAQKNIEGFKPYLLDAGMGSTPYWNFIDWGYASLGRRTDLALNLHFYDALSSLQQWATILGRDAEAKSMGEAKDTFSWGISGFLSGVSSDFERIGYHGVVLALKNGFIANDEKAKALMYVKNFILGCYPNNILAPRLSAPEASDTVLFYTPYFTYYTFPVLLDNKEGRFVYDQYRRAWGPFINKGLTTLPEVFDERWSHCHQWSANPTWQLSRYALGLHPDRGEVGLMFHLNLVVGDLRYAKGTIPIPGNKSVYVSWERRGRLVEYTLETPVPITLNIPPTLKVNQTGKVEVRNRLKLLITVE